MMPLKIRTMVMRRREAMPSKKTNIGTSSRPARRKQVKNQPQQMIMADYAVPEYAIWECTACLAATPAGSCSALCPAMNVTN